MVKKIGIVGKPRLEEIGVCRNTYLFFEFGDYEPMAWPWIDDTPIIPTHGADERAKRPPTELAS